MTEGLLGIESLLKEAFDLNSYEAKVYIALMAGPLSPKDTSAASKVPLPRVYDTLRGLTEKGFVQYVGGSYRSVRPEVALESRMANYDHEFDEKQAARKEAKLEIIKRVAPLHRGTYEMKRPVMLSGIESIGGAFLDIISSSSDILFLVRKAMKAKSRFIAYLESTSTSGKKIRIILPPEAGVTASDIEFAKASGIELRSYANPILDMMVADEKDVVLGVP
jgi:sugar-specific transcriptional regulator TrmB